MKKRLKGLIAIAFLFIFIVGFNSNDNVVKAEGGVSTVKFSHRGFSDETGEMDDLEITPEQARKLTPNAFVRPGFKFKQWKACQSLPDPEDSDCRYYVDEAEFSVANIGETWVLKPVWEKFILLSFDANGGTGSMKPMPVFGEESITLPNNMFEKTGYNFIGWSIGYMGLEPLSIKNADTNCSNEVEFTDGETIVFEDGGYVTLCAVWEESKDVDEDKDDNESTIVTDLPETGQSNMPIIASLALLTLSSGLVGSRYLINRK